MARVAVKVASPVALQRGFLVREGMMYDHLQGEGGAATKEFSGYGIVPPMSELLISAIAPKFFGLYVPLEDINSLIDEVVAVSDEPEAASEWVERILTMNPGEKMCGRSPILLTEDCGEPCSFQGLSHDEK